MGNYLLSPPGSGGGAPSGPAGGDLTGNYPNPGVGKIAGIAISGTPAAGGILVATSPTAASWQSIGGDLSGTMPNPTVRGLQGTVVLSGAAAAGNVLTASSPTAASWAAPAGGPPSGAAGGDLSGTYPNPGVAKIAGVSVSGTPSNGQIIVALTSTTASWQTVAGASGPYVTASSIGLTTANSDTTNATNLLTALASGGVLQNGGTLFCDFDGVANVNVAPAGSNVPIVFNSASNPLTIMGRGWETTIHFTPAGSSINRLQGFSLSGVQNIIFRDICIQGVDNTNSTGGLNGGQSAVIRHNGTAGYIKLEHVWLRHGTFLIEVNPSTTTAVGVYVNDSWLQGYGAGVGGNQCTCIGAFDGSGGAYSPTKRVVVANTRFSDFGDPTGGNLLHAMYITTSFAMDVNHCQFDTPSPSSTGWCIQHYDSIITLASAAPTSRVTDCIFASNLSTQNGVVTSYNTETQIGDCSFEQVGSSIDVWAAGKVLIDNCTFYNTTTGGIFFGAQGQATGLTWGGLIRGCRFRGALAAGQNWIGAAQNGMSLSIEDCEFTGATATNGLMIFFQAQSANDECIVKNCKFDGSPAYAVQASAATLGQGTCTVEGNRFNLGNAGSVCVGTGGTGIGRIITRQNEFVNSTQAMTFGAGVPGVWESDLNYGAGWGAIGGYVTTAGSRTGLATDEIVAFTSTSSAFTYTPPTASKVHAGKKIIIKDTSGAAATNNITIAGTIDGATQKITTNFGKLTIASDGTSAWHVVA